MDSITLTQLWTAGGVLIGFQLIALSWRIQREAMMESVRERTWITLADYVALASLLMLTFGVFAVPILNINLVDIAAKMFGWALVMFVSYPIILIGHYNLYCSWGKYNKQGKRKSRPRVTNQEWVAFVACAILLFLYLLCAITFT